MEAGRLAESGQNCNPGWQEWMQVQTTTDCRALSRVASALTLLYHVVRLAVSKGLSPDYTEDTICAGCSDTQTFGHSRLHEVEKVNLRQPLGKGSTLTTTDCRALPRVASSADALYLFL